MQTFRVPKLQNWNFSKNQDIKAIKFDGEFLLAQARQAQSRWAPLSAATRNRKGACLKSFFNWLFNEGYLESNLAQQIHLTKRKPKLARFLSVDEALNLVSWVENQAHQKQSETNSQIKTLILLPYGAGLRVSEAGQLRWKDIDLTGRVMPTRGNGH